MPAGVVRGAVSTGLFPVSLSTKFTESHSVMVRTNEYHDGASQRQSMVAGGRRSWKASKRLTVPELQTLSDHWEANRNTAFGFYNPSETSPPFTRNPSGSSGYYLVRYASDWEDTVGMVRSDASIELIELASSDEMSAAGVIQAFGAPVASVTLTVITEFTQSVDYQAFATIATSDLSNIFNQNEGISYAGAGWTKRTDTFRLDPASLVPASLKLYFAIQGSLLGAGLNEYKVYDAFLSVVFADGTLATLRPSAASSLDNTGVVTNAGLAMDGNTETFADIQKTDFGSLGFFSPPLLILSGWTS